MGTCYWNPVWLDAYFWLTVCVIPILGQLGALLLGPYMLDWPPFHWTLPGMPNLSRFSKVFKISQRHWFVPLQTIIVFLFTLLLIVPGVVRAISYSMSYYILADSGMAATWKCSTKYCMMEGYKIEIFPVWCCGFGLYRCCASLHWGGCCGWPFAYKWPMQNFTRSQKRFTGELI